VAKDAELDRLGTTQDQTFKRQQDAWQAQDQAWKVRSSAKDALEKAYQDKQRAYEAQEASWQDYLRVKQANGPRIDSLNAQQEAAYQNMKTAFDNASAAYNSRDGVMASTYAAEGHRHKAESQGYVAERRRLVEEIRSARTRHEATKPAFQAAKAQFGQVKSAYDRAKEDHVRKQDEFKRAKAEFVQAKDAFHKRLEVVRAESKRRKDDKRALAEKAGVPYQYLDNVYVSREPDGTINIYFGGLGTPDGPGHGHYALASSGNVTYKRDPFDPHGAQNFEKAAEAATLYIRSARIEHNPLGTNNHGGVFYRRDDAGGTILHITQYFNDNYHVSWDATDSGNRNVHWTNQNVPNGHPDRFNPPSDAIVRL
jgi:hypothetical protein